MAAAEELKKDWVELEKELSKFEADHKEYVKKLDEVEVMKTNYFQKYEKFKKKLFAIKQSTTKVQDLDPELVKQVDENINYMKNISDTFPRKNGIYLSVIIGGVNVSILNKDEKWKYKEEYEKFKFILTLISLAYSMILIAVDKYRVLDAVLNFLLVWYYCTLTIRESILVVNGSKIKGWWRLHHFIATVCAAILLIWPDSETYSMFRTQFIVFTFYLSVVQLLQYYYQRGCLYRLRALGDREEMAITTEGFQSWMTRGLSFILPFLFIGYFFQLYNAYVLFRISQLPICDEWQVKILSVIFLILSVGNFCTTLSVIRKKIVSRFHNLSRLKYKYVPWRNLSTPADKTN